MERTAEAFVQGRAVERIRLLREGKVVHVARERETAGWPIGVEIAVGPLQQPGVLDRQHRHPLPRVRRRQVDPIAVVGREVVVFHAGVGRIAKAFEDLSPQRRLRRGRAGKQPQGIRGQEVAGGTPAEIAQEPGIDPLVLHQAREHRVDHAGERRARRPQLRRQIGRGLEDDVVHGDDRLDAGRVVRRRHDDPGAGDRDLPPVDADRRVDRAVTGVVVPEVVVREGHGDHAGDRRTGAAHAAEDEQPPGVIGPQLAKRHLAGRGTCRRRSERWHLAPSAFAFAPPIDRGPGSIRRLARSVIAALRRGERVGSGAACSGAAGRPLAWGMSRAMSKLYQAAFVLARWTRPADVGVGGRHLGDDLAVPIEAVEAEARRLPLDPPRGVLEPAGRHGMWTGRLRAEEPLIRAIADPGDADGGVNHDLFDLVAIALPTRCQRAIPGEARGERRCRRDRKRRRSAIDGDSSVMRSILVCEHGQRILPCDA